MGNISGGLVLFLGDYLLVGCEQPIIRIYDVSTGQCFVGQSFMSQHQDIITGVEWSADGKLYVSASADGNIKVSRSKFEDHLCQFRFCLRL